MKIMHLLIGASTLAISSMAMAQSIGQPPKDVLTGYFVRQDPGATFGTPADPNANYSEIDQTHNGNTATTTQAAATNHDYTKIEQGRASSADAQNNRATTNQSGNYGSAYINQVAAQDDNTTNVVAGGAPTNFGTGGPNGGTGYASGLFNGTLAVTDAQLGGAGTKNNVNVTQTGGAGATSAATSNQAVVLQGSAITGVAAGGAIRSVATITQSGDTNQTIVQQGGGNDDNDGNDQTTVSQTGSGNYAENRQNEADRSNITQSANAPGGGVNNTAYVDQIPAIGAGGSDDYGRQSAVRQFGRDNIATVSQGGRRNTSAVVQGDNGGAGAGSGTRDSHDNSATVAENGADGYSEVFQGVGSGDTNSAFVTQDATASFENSYLYQNGPAGANNNGNVEQAGTRDVSTMYQNGTFGTAYVFQGTGFPTTTADNTVVVNQASTSDTAFAQVFQDGTNSDVTVTQNGAKGSAFVDQGFAGGADDNSVTITQANAGAVAGSGPTAIVLQGNTAASTGNTATVEQRIGAAGSASLARIEQNGDDNTASIFQNVATVQGFITQTGSMNTATINQLLNAGNVSVINQTGDGNSATTNQ